MGRDWLASEFYENGLELGDFSLWVFPWGLLGSHYSDMGFYAFSEDIVDTNSKVLSHCVYGRPCFNIILAGERHHGVKR
jgi:hypothetical protein